MLATPPRAFNVISVTSGGRLMPGGEDAVVPRGKPGAGHPTATSSGDRTDARPITQAPAAGSARFLLTELGIHD